MNAPRTTPTIPARTPTRLRWTSMAGLVLLGAACSGDGPVSPPAMRAPAASALVSAARAPGDPGPFECAPDSKLIGRIALTTDDTPGTWWHLTREGLDAAGITDYWTAIEGFFGRDFASEAEAIAFLVEQTRAGADANGNGYVCAYEIRGTRAAFRDPNIQYYLFQVRDDRHAGS